MAHEQTYQELKALLPVSKHELDDALEKQADIMERISSRVVHWNSRVASTKEELAKLESRIAYEVRESAGGKVTLDGIAGIQLRNPDRARCWDKLQENRSQLELWQGLLDAWRSRGFAIKALCDLYAAQYYSVNTHQARPASDAGFEARRLAMRQASAPAKTKTFRRELT